MQRSTFYWRNRTFRIDPITADYWPDARLLFQLEKPHTVELHVLAAQVYRLAFPGHEIDECDAGLNNTALDGLQETCDQGKEDEPFSRFSAACQQLIENGWEVLSIPATIAFIEQRPKSIYCAPLLEKMEYHFFISEIR